MGPKKEAKRISEHMFIEKEFDRIQIGGEKSKLYENNIKESISKYIGLINNLCTLTNVQLVAFVNILSINNPEFFEKLSEITEWESKILSEFMNR